MVICICLTGRSAPFGGRCKSDQVSSAVGNVYSVPSGVNETNYRSTIILHPPFEAINGTMYQ